MLSAEEFIQRAPKAELHLHIEGTLEPALMFKLIERNGMHTRFKSVDEVQSTYNFKNLQSFLDIYYEGVNVLREERDFFDLTWEYLGRAARQNIKHIEIFFDPQAHTGRGIQFHTVITGISKALKKGKSEFGMSSRLILCFLRHLSEGEAMKTLNEALFYKDAIIAVGLDSSEKGNPPKKFMNVFAKARSEGFLAVAHAGEEGPPNYIWQALDLLKASRIDHGVRCLEDKKLIERLAKERIPLTVCPLSNVKLHVFDRMEDHNLKKLLGAGLCVTVNSDDPAYFGGYLNENLLAVKKALKLSKANMATIIRNGFEASFIPEKDKHKFMKETDGLMK